METARPLGAECHCEWPVDLLESQGLLYCDVCCLPISCAAYVCFDCEFFRHKSCYELPKEKTHPLHPHPLDFLDESPGTLNCNACHDVCKGSAYYCSICHDFNLDIKCASLTNIQCQLLAKEEITTKVFVPNKHRHVLSLFNCEREFNLKCDACRLPLSGTAYSCMACTVYFFHDSCANLQEYISHPYHQHPLFLDIKRAGDMCYVCKEKIWGFSYRCNECPSFKLHTTCINSSTCSIKLNRHDHDLFYFEANELPSTLECNTCCKSCSSGSFYRCFECDFNIHSECVPIPLSVRQDCHVHPLIYTYPDVGDTSKEYYCMACEEERDSNFPFYRCEKCSYTAHIGCVISESESSEPVREDSGVPVIVPENKEREEGELSQVGKEISDLKVKIENEAAKLESTEDEVDAKEAVLEAKSVHINELTTLLMALESKLSKMSP